MLFKGIGARKVGIVEMINLRKNFPIGSHCRITSEGDEFDDRLCKIIGHLDNGLELLYLQRGSGIELAKKIATDPWPIDQVIPLSPLEELAMALENDESV